MINSTMDNNNDNNINIQFGDLSMEERQRLLDMDINEEEEARLLMEEEDDEVGDGVVDRQQEHQEAAQEVRQQPPQQQQQLPQAPEQAAEQPQPMVLLQNVVAQIQQLDRLREEQIVRYNQLQHLLQQQQPHQLQQQQQQQNHHQVQQRRHQQRQPIWPTVERQRPRGTRGGRRRGRRTQPSDATQELDNIADFIVSLVASTRRRQNHIHQRHH